MNIPEKFLMQLAVGLCLIKQQHSLKAQTISGLSKSGAIGRAVEAAKRSGSGETTVSSILRNYLSSDAIM